ncbi:MAG: ferrochelatase [Gemmatimonadota bacterium]|nr:ferrochelatase [Gemmatimonadota bacterium]
MPTASSVHLILANLGTPREPTAASVREFLDEFLSDPAVVDFPRWLWQPVLHGVILRRRPPRIAHAYRTIWTSEGSPLRVATERMVRAVRGQLPAGATVSAAYRYGTPSLDTEFRRLAAGRVDRVIVVPLFPQRTDATTGTIVKVMYEAAARAGLVSRVEARMVEPADVGYVGALAHRWREAVADAGEPEHLVVSFHGIPVRFDKREGRRYTRDCAATTTAFLQAIGWHESRATLAFQSKFGPEPWITPPTAGVNNDLGRRGVRHVAVATPGFLTEGLETLEEIGIRAHDDFRANGGERLTRIGAVEDHHAMVGSLAALARA